MDYNRLSESIKRDISGLYQRRFPEKGVEVPIPGFDEAINRRKELLRRVSRHVTESGTRRRKRERLERTQRRMAHVRNELDQGARLIAVAAVWHRDAVIGVEINGPDGPETLMVGQITVGEINKRLADLARDMNRLGDFLVCHNVDMLRSNFAASGIRLPMFEKTLDTAQFSMVIYSESMSSAYMGEQVGVLRSDYPSHGAYMAALASHYVNTPDEWVLRKAG